MNLTGNAKYAGESTTPSPSVPARSKARRNRAQVDAAVESPKSVQVDETTATGMDQESILPDKKEDVSASDQGRSAAEDASVSADSSEIIVDNAVIQLELEKDNVSEKASSVDEDDEGAGGDDWAEEEKKLREQNRSVLHHCNRKFFSKLIECDQSKIGRGAKEVQKNVIKRKGILFMFQLFFRKIRLFSVGIRCSSWIICFRRLRLIVPSFEAECRKQLH